MALETVSVQREGAQASGGRRLPFPSLPGKAVTQNQFDEQAICLWRQANAYPNIAFPLRPEVEIKDWEQQVLLLAEWVKGRDRSEPPKYSRPALTFGRMA